MNTIIGNDKSGVFLEVFHTPKPFVVSTFLRGVFEYAKTDSSVISAKNIPEGYSIDFDTYSVELHSKLKFSFSKAHAKSFVVKLRLNPIRIVNNSHFNFLKQSFSWEYTQSLFVSAKENFKEFLTSFITLSDDEINRFLIPKKISFEELQDGLFSTDNDYGIIHNDEFDYPRKYVSEKDLGAWLREHKSIAEQKYFFKDYFIDKLEITNVFELSITCDIHFPSESEKIAFFQFFKTHEYPYYLSNVTGGTTVKYSPYDKTKHKPLTDRLPVLRTYIKLHDVHRLATQKIQSLRDRKQSLQAKIYNGMKEGNLSFIPYPYSASQYEQLIKEQTKIVIESIEHERSEADRLLKHAVRVEVDFRQDRAIKKKYGTADFYSLKFDNRLEILEYFVNHLNDQNTDILIQEAIDIILQKGVRRKGSINLLEYINSLQLPTKSQVVVLNSLQDDSVSPTALRMVGSRLRKQNVISGKGQNSVVIPPFTMAQDYLNFKLDVDLKQLKKSILHEVQNVTPQHQTLQEKQENRLKNPNPTDRYNILYNINNNITNKTNNNTLAKRSNTSLCNVTSNSLNHTLQTQKGFGQESDSLTETSLLTKVQNLIQQGMDSPEQLFSNGITTQDFEKLLRSGEIYMPRSNKVVILE
jgi:hypothetical protein